jgi:hypothetical protein
MRRIRFPRSRIVPVGAPLAALAALAATARPAGAHVAPSERENNRYLLIAPLADRVRIAYTVWMGQEPGRRARARMDANRDGRIDPDEADEVGRQIAAQVLPHLTVVVDGAPVAIAWNEIDVGLGEPSADGGAFAVDLVAWLCLERPRERLTHRILLRDGFRIPEPGETELRVEESPGLRVTRSDLGGPETLDAAAVRLDFRWMGGPGPLATEGYRLDFDVDPALATFDGGECTGAGRGAAAPPSRAPWLLGGAAAIAALALGGWLGWSRRRRVRR